MKKNLKMLNGVIRIRTSKKDRNSVPLCGYWEVDRAFVNIYVQTCKRHKMQLLFFVRSSLRINDLAENQSIVM